MAASVHYRVNHVDLGGNTLGELTQADDYQWQVVRNDACSFGFSLDVKHPMVPDLLPLSSVIKMWRDVVDPVYGINYTRPSAFPNFAGRIGSRRKQGRKIYYTAFDPLWKLKFHFHLLNHRLSDPLAIATDPTAALNASIPATLSGLVWKLINLVQNAFGEALSTSGLYINGLQTGTDTAVFDGVYRVAASSWTWEQHITYLLKIIDGIDLQLIYQHVEGDPAQAIFFALHPGIGTDRTPSGAGQVNFEWGPGLSNTLEASPDFDETFEPQRFGNYVRAYGQGQKDTTFSFSDSNTDVADPLSVPNVGVFMYQDKQDTVITSAKLQDVVDQDLLRQGGSPAAYTIRPRTSGPPYYGIHYSIGDLVNVASIDGEWVLPTTKLRIEQATMKLTAANQEVPSLSVVPDFGLRFG